jgi:hypothetical protein
MLRGAVRNTVEGSKPKKERKPAKAATPNLKVIDVKSLPQVLEVREGVNNEWLVLLADRQYPLAVYGILICDLVRHVANAFEVNESAVWEWVDQERNRPTDTSIEIKIARSKSRGKV